MVVESTWLACGQWVLLICAPIFRLPAKKVFVQKLFGGPDYNPTTRSHVLLSVYPACITCTFEFAKYGVAPIGRARGDNGGFYLGIRGMPKSRME